MSNNFENLRRAAPVTALILTLGACSSAQTTEATPEATSVTSAPQVPTEVMQTLLTEHETIQPCTTDQLPEEIRRAVDSFTKSLQDKNGTAADFQEEASEVMRNSLVITNAVSAQLEDAGGGTTQLAQPTDLPRVIVQKLVNNSTVNISTYSFENNGTDLIDFCRTTAVTFTNDATSVKMSYQIADGQVYEITASQGQFSTIRPEELAAAAVATLDMNNLVPANADFDLPKDFKSKLGIEA